LTSLKQTKEQEIEDLNKGAN